MSWQWRNRAGGRAAPWTGRVTFRNKNGSCIQGRTVNLGGEREVSPVLRGGCSSSSAGWMGCPCVLGRLWTFSDWTEKVVPPGAIEKITTIHAFLLEREENP